MAATLSDTALTQLLSVPSAVLQIRSLLPGVADDALSMMQDSLAKSVYNCNLGTSRRAAAYSPDLFINAGT